MKNNKDGGFKMKTSTKILLVISVSAFITMTIASCIIIAIINNRKNSPYPNEKGFTFKELSVGLEEKEGTWEEWEEFTSTKEDEDGIGYGQAYKNDKGQGIIIMMEEVSEDRKLNKAMLAIVYANLEKSLDNIDISSMNDALGGRAELVPTEEAEVVELHGQKWIAIYGVLKDNDSGLGLDSTSKEYAVKALTTITEDRMYAVIYFDKDLDSSCNLQDVKIIRK